MVDVRPAAWCAALAALLAAAAMAHAGPIQDHHFQVEEIVGGKVVPGSVRAVKVKSDPHHVEVTQWGPGGNVSLDFSASHPDRAGDLLVTSSATAQFAKTSDILRIDDTEGHPGTFTSFGILSKSPDLNSISFGWRIDREPGFVAVNLGGIHFTSHSSLDFGFTVADAPKTHPKEDAHVSSFAVTSSVPRDTPEPATLTLLGVGSVGGLAGWWWRRRGNVPGLDRTAAAG